MMSALCLLCACVIAYHGQNGWGWFLFAALLFGGK